jgi:hypothetical protein
MMAALLRNLALEEAAQICEAMRPHGGRAFDEAQAACFAALSDAAENIRKLKGQLPQSERT